MHSVSKILTCGEEAIQKLRKLSKLMFCKISLSSVWACLRRAKAGKSFEEAMAGVHARLSCGLVSLDRDAEKTMELAWLLTVVEELPNLPHLLVDSVTSLRGEHVGRSRWTKGLGDNGEPESQVEPCRGEDSITLLSAANGPNQERLNTE